LKKCAVCDANIQDGRWLCSECQTTNDRIENRKLSLDTGRAYQ
jgi:predicted nucleic acid-binding Zn ribbon protein